MLVSAVGSSCQSPEYYSRELSQTEQQEYSQQLLQGISSAYQGSPKCQMLLQEALSLDSSNADIWRELGAPYLKRGLGRSFYDHYHKAVILNPGEWTGWRGYIYLYFYRDYQRALADLNATDVLSPDFVDYANGQSVDYMRALCHFHLGDLNQARAYIDKHINQETEKGMEDFLEPVAFVVQFHIYQEMNEKQAAAEVIRRARSVHPDNADLWYWQTTLLAEAGKQAGAREALQHAQERYKQALYNHRPYVEEFFQIYQADLDTMNMVIQRL